MTFVLDDHGDNTQLTLYSLRDGMQKSASADLPHSVVQMAVGTDSIYLLGERDICAYSRDLDQNTTMERQDCRALAAVDGNLYGATTSQLIHLPSFSQQLLQDIEDQQSAAEEASKPQDEASQPASSEEQPASGEEESQSSSSQDEESGSSGEESSGSDGSSEESSSGEESSSQYQPVVEDRP